MATIGIKTCEFPYDALLLAYDLGMGVDQYMTGTIDTEGNKLMFLNQNTHECDREAFAEMYADSIS